MGRQNASHSKRRNVRAALSGGERGVSVLSHGVAAVPGAGAGGAGAQAPCHCHMESRAGRTLEGRTGGLSYSDRRGGGNGSLFAIGNSNRGTAERSAQRARTMAIAGAQAVGSCLRSEYV